MQDTAPTPQMEHGDIAEILLRFQAHSDSQVGQKAEGDGTMEGVTINARPLLLPTACFGQEFVKRRQPCTKAMRAVGRKSSSAGCLASRCIFR